MEGEENLTVSIISDFPDETLDDAAATAATPGIRGTRHFVLVVVQLPSHRPHRKYDTQGKQQARRGGITFFLSPEIPHPWNLNRRREFLLIMDSNFKLV